ncbi:MAG: Ig-like domain-containing protein [Candidatus Thiodiazotropha sp.]
MNDAPVASDDSVGTNEDTPVTVDVLPNDSDPDGDTLTVSSVTQGTTARLRLIPSVVILFTPESGFQRYRYLHLYDR